MQGEAEENQAHVRALWEKLLVAATAKNWAEADRLFNEARAFAKSNDMTFLDLHVLYAKFLIEQREDERSYPHLAFLRDMYSQVRITDYSFLGIRGVPPFEAYLGVVKDYLSARPENMARLDLLESLLDALDAEGKAATREAMASLRGAGHAG